MSRPNLLTFFFVLLIFSLPISLYYSGSTLWENYQSEHNYEISIGLNGDEIYLDGEISATMAADLERHLDETKPAVHSVYITSPGGTAEGAEGLVKVLADHPNVILRIAENGRCFSACVGVFAGLNRLNRAIADDKACFLFHAGSAGSRERRVSDCEIRTPDHTLVMDRWVAETSPRLSTFLAGCRQNPTHTLRGMLLDSKQLMEIAKSRYAVTCEAHVPSESCLRWFENYQQCPR